MSKFKCEQKIEFELITYSGADPPRRFPTGIILEGILLKSIKHPNTESKSWEVRPVLPLERDYNIYVEEKDIIDIVKE